jgi:predicted porin
MKKLLLATVAVSGLALAAAPAYAEVNLEVGGYFKGYGAYADTDANDSQFDIIRDTELHVGGETTLDNGLTVGVHFEISVDGEDSSAVDESYLYFSGDWGRVNFGNEDGSAYLLPVAAPSADSNLDGVRQFVSPFGSTAVDYAQDVTRGSDKFTYLSPIFSGFQAGVSYTSTNNAAGSFGLDDDTDSVIEGAVRYEGQFQNVGVIAGGGYTTSEDDYDAFNVGLDLDIAAFGIGAAYLNEDDDSDDTDTFVVGADYTTGPFKLGLSYLNSDADATDTEIDRYTAGVTYNYGPGMSFRGSVQHIETDVAGADNDGTAVVIGTQVNF